MKMKNNKGFTLIELIVTITIVIALALFITPKVVKFSNDSKATGYKEIEKRFYNNADIDECISEIAEYIAEHIK